MGRVGIEVQIYLLDVSVDLIAKQVGQGYGALGFPPELGPEVPNLGHFLLVVNHVSTRPGKAEHHGGDIYSVVPVILAVTPDVQQEREARGLHIEYVITNIETAPPSHDLEPPIRSVTVHDD